MIFACVPLFFLSLHLSLRKVSPVKRDFFSAAIDEMRFMWNEGQTTDKWIANLSVLACNLILLRLIPAVTFSFGSESSQDNWFGIFTGLCRNVLSRKSTILCNPHCILMNICGDTPCAVSNSPASKTKLGVLGVQIRLLIKPLQQNKKTHPGTAAQISSHTGAPLSLSTLTLFFFLPYFILNLPHFSNLPSPSLFLTLHCLFSDSKSAVFLYI